MALKAEVIDLIALLSDGQAAADTVPRLFDDVVRELAASVAIVTEIALVSVSAADATFTAPTEAAEVLACFYGHRELSIEGKTALEAFYGVQWRALEGPPRAVTLEDEDKRTFRMVPKPTQDSAPYVPLHGASPLGRDYPHANVAVLYSKATDDPPYYLKLPIALEVLAREFERESDHRDRAFAGTARMLATRSLAMVL